MAYEKNWIASTGAFVSGAILGFVIAQIVARLLYRSGGNTTVAKVGISSLSLTIPAGMAGGIVTAAIVGILMRVIFSEYNQDMTLFGTTLGLGS